MGSFGRFLRFDRNAIRFDPYPLRGATSWPKWQIPFKRVLLDYPLPHNTKCGKTPKIAKNPKNDQKWPKKSKKTKKWQKSQKRPIKTESRPPLQRLKAKMAQTTNLGPKNGPKKVTKKWKRAAQKTPIFFGEILDSVRNQHFCNAGLSSCPHTTTSARAPDRTPPRVPTLW